MPAEPRWLSLERLVRINEAEVEATGERHRLRDAGLLESAWAKPRNRHLYQGEADVVRLAAALLDGICQNHCFEQGNKRTAATAAILFLRVNGYRWTAPDTEDLGRLVEAFVEDRATEDDLVAFMKGFLEPVA